MKNKAFSLIEVTIALFILALSVSFLVTFAINYLRILVSIRERFIALNLAQEGLELAIALRNKQIETGASPWYGNGITVVPGNYCIDFNTSESKIFASRKFSEQQPCPVIPGYSRLIKYEPFGNFNLAVKVTSIVNFGNNIVQLDTILTKWHQIQK